MEAALGATVVLMFLFAIGAGSFFMQTSAGESAVAALIAMVPVAQLLIGMFLWKRSSWLAHRMVGEKGSAVVSINLTPQDVLSLAVAVAGVFLLVGGVRSMIITLTPATMEEFRFWHWWSTSEWRSQLIAAMACIVIGCWLVIGSRGWATLISRLRNARRTVDEDGVPPGDEQNRPAE